MNKCENIVSQRALCIGREAVLAVPFSVFTAGKGMRGDTDLLASLISAFLCESRYAECDCGVEKHIYF